MRVKICGITNLEDAMMAAEYGADAIGFIFAPESPRFTPPETVRKIVSSLPAFVTTVGVFTSGEEKDFRRAIEECGVDLIQFHGPFSPETIRPFASRAIKVIRVQNEKSLDEISSHPVRAILLDTYHDQHLGGSGVSFDWKIAAKATQWLGRIILAGGLTPENVEAAIAAVRPYGVDVSSGVEIETGGRGSGVGGRRKKDHVKMKRFIEAAKRAGEKYVVTE
ncbi:MAG: phosphoribosylanthranilate isomerase [Candidatus Manganitrophus sp.]|nr:phosphoribosylanthranilate isomerase [Candidatus Manganitrophus sp.]